MNKDDNNELSWTPESIDKLITYYDDRVSVLEDEIDDSSYPPGEEKEISECEACVSLLRDMKNKKSWTYRHAHVK